MFTRLRTQFGITAALLAVLALALPAFASANPLGSIVMYGGLAETSFVRVLTPGPDGNVWFVNNTAGGGAPTLGRIQPSGKVEEFVSGVNLSGLNAESNPTAIVAGPGGSKYLWFTDRGATPAIGVIDSASPETAVEFSIEGKGGNAGSVPQGIAVGSDGNLWFADASESIPAIGKIELSAPNEIKSITECSVGLNAGSQPHGIIAGPDGNLWFTDTGSTRAIGRINPSTCEIKEFATGSNSQPGGSNAPVGPWGIAAGPDGNVWFSEAGNNSTEGRSATGKAVGRITPSGTITYFSEGLLPSSQPTALTAANGKLWLADKSGVNEQQEVEIKDSGTLGGTYKLALGGKETGWAGKGNISGFTATGDVKRYTSTTCKRTTASKELKECAEGGSEVGMRISGTGIPAKTTIEKIEGKTIFLTLAATSGTGTATTVTAGWIRNVTFSTSKAEVGQQVAGTGLTTSEVIAVGELEGKGTITPATAPTAAGTGVSLTGGLKTISSVTTTSGCPVKGEEISGTGIPAGTTIATAPSGCEPTTLSISNFPTETATGVSLSANLPFNASSSTVQGALEKLSTVGAENVVVSGVSTTSPITRTLLFEAKLGAQDVELVTCNGAALTGTSPSCTVKTTTAPVFNEIDSITTSGAITTYPKEELFYGDLTGIAYGADGNLWVASGFLSGQKIGKFGIDTGPTNLRTLTLTKSAGGTGGTGMVTSKPKGVNCGTGCDEAAARMYENSTVVLKAKASTGSTIASWTGCESSTGVGGVEGTCTVSMTANKSVEVAWSGTSKAIIEPKALTLSKGESEQNGGKGTVKAAGLACEAECDETAVLYQGPVLSPKFKAGKAIELKETPAFGSEFTGWSGACSGSEPTCKLTMEEAKSVTAEFAAKPTTTLTIEKNSYATGTGSVTSKPKAVNCGTTCTTQDATVPEGEAIVLKEKPGLGMTFAGWSGGGCSGTAETCTVTLSEATKVKATFSGAPKAIVEAKTLTLDKAGSGFGTVKAAGLTCEALCSSATSLYQGPVLSPKFKAGKLVTLKAISAPGSKAVEWGPGCESNPTPSECVVTMEMDKTITATFNELE